MNAEPSLAPALPGCVAVGTLAQATRHKSKFQAVLTLEDPAARYSDRMRVHNPSATTQLVLSFEDADLESYGFATATVDQVERLLAFGGAYAETSLLVHCMHGIGRSTAAAIAILAERLGPGQEMAAIDQVRAMRPAMTPNLVVMSHADALLGREGRLLAALLQSETGNAFAQRQRQARANLASSRPDLFAKRA